MSLFPTSPAQGRVPLLNSACPWASSEEDLRRLWNSPYTSAVTTRTATLEGFPDEPSLHQVTFFGTNAHSTANSFGFSPHPLSSYLSWLRPLIRQSPERKLVIVSIGGNEKEIETMLRILQNFADEVCQPVAAEYNASCPNIPGHPPPAYIESQLSTFLALLARYASPTLKIGIKLPPYTFQGQYDALLRCLVEVAGSRGGADHPISFLTLTNTLGQGLVLAEQMTNVLSDPVAQRRKPAEEVFALPSATGGLAGAAVHQLSLGNVYRLTTLLRSPSSPYAKRAPSLKQITIIGVGGAHDAASVERFRKAGADAVACATALGREGVSVFERMAGEAVQAKL
ncbi:dihydroorotate dehydrogenase [Rhodotorula toruloides]